MKWIVVIVASLSSVMPLQGSDTVQVQKSPTRAVLFSLVPGGGQMYNGKYLKSVLIFGLEAYMVSQFLENRDAYLNWSEGSSLPKHRYREKRNKYAWWVGFIYVYNLVDALVDSHLSTFDDRDFQQVNDSVGTGLVTGEKLEGR